jgi:hypothetical protein
MKMLNIISLGSSTFEQLYGAFSAAFSDYEVQLIAEQFRSLLQRRGFVPELSFGAFDEDSLESFTLTVSDFIKEREWPTILEQGH